MKTLILKSFICSLVFCVTFLLFFLLAKALYVNVNSGDILSATSWNSLIQNVSKISYNWSETVISWTVNLGYEVVNLNVAAWAPITRYYAYCPAWKKAFWWSCNWGTSPDTAISSNFYACRNANNTSSLIVSVVCASIK